MFAGNCKNVCVGVHCAGSVVLLRLRWNVEWARIIVKNDCILHKSCPAKWFLCCYEGSELWGWGDWLLVNAAWVQPILHGFMSKNHLLINLKDKIFEPAVGSLPNLARMCP